jgi:hypothetical protein
MAKETARRAPGGLATNELSADHPGRQPMPHLRYFPRAAVDGVEAGALDSVLQSAKGGTWWTRKY